MAVESHPWYVNLINHVLWWICGWHQPARGNEREVEALILDPCEWLRDESATFSSLGWRMYLAWLPFVVIAIPLLFVGVIQPANTVEKEYLGWAGIVIVALLYLIGPALMMRRRIELDEVGFRVVAGQRSTLIPWNSLAPGRDWSIRFFQVRLSINNVAAELIQTTAKGEQKALSQQQSLVGMSVEGSDLVLTWCFQLNPDLFMNIARLMAGASASTEARQTTLVDFGLEQHVASLAVDKSVTTAGTLPMGLQRFRDGTLQLPLSAVTFPRNCCRCGIQTETHQEVPVAARHVWLFPSGMSATLEMPVCEECQQNMTLRYLFWLVGLESLWACVAWLFFLWPTQASTVVCLFVVALGLLPIFWILSFPCLWWRVAKVVKNITTNELRFRFAHPHYSDTMIEAIHARD